jgi:hypothetical protein
MRHITEVVTYTTYNTKDRQPICNVSMRHDRTTIVAEENK